ncbi:adenylyl-sulfate kinase [Serratia rhizosphaerae]|uniref:adenylyl-sulfate kinase n=1 Tax=Serratia TaxID=613 RepID=UPI000CF5E130|nr:MULTISPECIES: adenylyl-sulfate kinase [Serratia]MBU3893530.1 adenylyl-sulfate kinase [Serratia rubidaea]AVJ16317.1 adenylyl-sulfate kinase [Serratia sp. MYb239]QNK31738.1 adenylyl-sulfate kinase [Serratia sp. JUb9]QPT14332.1 adenylyl-sulfate kinase [Serratia rubidaea]CAE1142754.1 adenosine 5'-phosphosulfate kinase [Serratia sp. Tan611]
MAEREQRPTGPDDENVVWHPHAVTRADRETRNGHRGVVLWFTGLSGSGKSTVAGALEQALHAMGVRTYLLDGDNVRHGLCRDLGFSDDDRRENIRRVGEVAKLMVDAGLVVLTAFISPHRAERQMVRDMLDDGQFVEVFVDTPLAICEARDPKGLYKKARAGELRNFTGIDAVYQAPEAADIHLNGEQLVTNLVAQLLDVLRGQAIIKP